MSLYRYLARLPLNRYVITASTIGIIGSTACILALKYSQRVIMKRPFCTKALEEIHKNQVLLDFLGTPIEIQPPDITDKSQYKLTAKETDLWIPFTGSKKSGKLRIYAERKIIQKDQSQPTESNSDEWFLKRVEIILNDIPDKMLIVYNNENENEKQ